MKHRTIRLIALVAVMALTTWGCGGDEGTDGGERAQAPGTGEGGEQSDILVEAFNNDPKKLGLDPIEPPDYAHDIVNVDTSQYEIDGTPRIAFAIQAPEFSWPATYNDAVKAHQEQAYPDIELIIRPTGLEEADTQVATIEDLLVQQPDVLIITPLTDVRGPVEQAAAQGTPVVLCTGTAETDAYVTRVDRDNYLNGAIGASWIAREVGNEGKIVMLSGPAGVPTAEARYEGATSVFEQYPDIEVLAHENTNWDAADGKKVMQALLTRFDEIDAVWADGAGQAIGAVEAFKEAGREIPPFAAEPLNGFLRLANEERFPFVAVGYPPTHSASCLDAAMDILAGKTLPSFINVDVPIFDQMNLEEWYRPDCVDDLWLPTPLSEEELVQQDLCEG
jgi:ribose transport system substrate-binding protein